MTQGWTPNQANLFLIGDYIQIGNELKMIVADVAADAGGAATLNFKPALRISPADTAQVITRNNGTPACIMKLENSDQVIWSAKSPIIYGMAISCEEALDL